MPNSRFYVTTPIYYVNDRPHVGHAYTSLLADVLAGYHRLLGIRTWLLTGTDEHGQKVQQAAEARGIDPQALCDETSQHFRDLLASLAVVPDDFIRTTEARHTTIVERVLARLHEQGDIYLDTYEGWYCTRCERFWTEKEVAEQEGDRCPAFPELHEVTRLAEPNYYFRMSKYAGALRTAIESGELEILPEKRKNEVLGFLDQGVGDLCISRRRERLHWGVPLPFDADYVCYVWVDALFNYKSAIGYLSDSEDERERHADWWPADVHLIGKDILTTHSVYWPTLLLAMGEPLPRRILAHGWLLDTSGRKLSKTKAAEDSEARPVPTIEGLLDVFGVDGTRWFLATAMKPGDDTFYDWSIVRERVNTDLANGIGNTANRLLKMLAGANEGRMPDLGECGPPEVTLRDAVAAATAAVRDFPASLDVTAVVAAVRGGIDAISHYLSDEKPWKLVKDPAGLPRAHVVLAWSLETLRILALCARPVLPAPMDRLRTALGVTGPVDFDAEAEIGHCRPGTQLGDPPDLFPRVNEDALPSTTT